MDSFIKDLLEQTKVTSKDYTVFDIADDTSGKYNTKKVSYDTIYKQLCSDVATAFNAKFSKMTTDINTVAGQVGSKLDKKGITFSSSEKMSGPLVVDQVSFSATGLSYFKNTVDVGSNYISNVKDPNVDQDAATKKYVDTKFGGIVIPSTSSFLQKSGDSMSAGDLTLFQDPTQDKHATNKKWVESQIATAKTTVTNTVTGYVSTNYLNLTGGTMTGSLVLKGFSELTPATDIAPVSNTLTLDLKNGNTFSINLNANINSFTLTNVPTDSFTITLFITIATPGSFSITWSVNGTTVKWSNNQSLVPTPTPGKVDVVCLTKIGTSWYGFIGGQNF